MRIRVRLFAMQRQQTGRRDVVLEIPAPATVASAWQELARAYPALEPAAASVRFARNGAYVEPQELLADGDELAVIPPVSGGTAMPGPRRSRRIELREEPFPETLPAELRVELSGPEDGAFIVFVGQTRESPGTAAPGQEREAARFAGRRVEHLGYEAFESMALAVLGTIADEVEARFGVRRLAILHRVGDVPLGDASVIVAAAAPHREEAFAACRYAIEELKARAPIWKAEHFADGSVWVGETARTGPPASPDGRASSGGGPVSGEPPTTAGEADRGDGPDGMV
jgi:molybdopterin synthase catalytic subunit